jgi:hypothetical protein
MGREKSGINVLTHCLCMCGPSHPHDDPGAQNHVPPLKQRDVMLWIRYNEVPHSRRRSSYTVHTSQQTAGYRKVEIVD